MEIGKKSRQVAEADPPRNLEKWKIGLVGTTGSENSVS